MYNPKITNANPIMKIIMVCPLTSIIIIFFGLFASSYLLKK
jgi:hypothetical protein